MKHRFHLTYEVVTEESAQDGDAAERGWLDLYGGRHPVEAPPEPMGFRDAVELFRSESADSASIEPNVVPMDDCPPRWISAIPTSCDEYGESVTVSLHIPEGVSGASRIRIARLLGAPSHW